MASRQAQAWPSVQPGGAHGRASSRGPYYLATAHGTTDSEALQSLKEPHWARVPPPGRDASTTNGHKRAKRQTSDAFRC